jgi:hypothetical protein
MQPFDNNTRENAAAKANGRIPRAGEGVLVNLLSEDRVGAGKNVLVVDLLRWSGRQTGNSGVIPERPRPL